MDASPEPAAASAAASEPAAASATPANIIQSPRAAPAAAIATTRPEVVSVLNTKSTCAIPQ